jgi:thiamine transport system permease protein
MNGQRLSLTQIFWRSLGVLTLGVAVGGGLLWPLWSLIERSGVLSAPGEFLAVISDPVVLSVLKFSVTQSLLSTLISAGLALILAWALDRCLDGEAGSEKTSLGLRSWVELLLKIPYGIPSVVAGFSMIALLRSHSLFEGLSYSASGVVLTHVILNTPWIALALLQATAQIPKQRRETARLLGASAWQHWKRVDWPVIEARLPGLLHQVFALCLTSFAIVLLVGGGPPVETLEVWIYSRMRLGAIQESQAIVGALVQLGVLVLAAIVFAGIQKAIGSKDVTEIAQAQRVRAMDAHPSQPNRMRWHGCLALILAVIWIAPYFFAQIQAVGVGADAGWNQENLNQLRAGVFHSLQISLISTALAGLICVLLFCLRIEAHFSPGLQSHRSRYLRCLDRGIVGLSVIPLGVSTLMLCLGWWVSYSQRSSPHLGWVVAIQAIGVLPIWIRLLSPDVRNLQVSLWARARVLGASGWQAWRWIEWPRLLPLFWSAVSLSLMVCLGEVAALSFFAIADWETLPTLIARASARYEFDQASHLTLVLMGLIVLAAALPSTGSWISNSMSKGRSK